MPHGRGSHFDLDVLDAFLEIEGYFRTIAGQFCDTEPDHPELTI